MVVAYLRRMVGKARKGEKQPKLQQQQEEQKMKHTKENARLQFIKQTSEVLMVVFPIL